MAWYEEAFDDSYLYTYDSLLSPEFTREQVDALERLLQLSPPADILDMPCGHGRHAVELALRGYRVTGVDLSARMLEVARERAQAAGVAVAGPSPGEGSGAEPEAAAGEGGGVELVRADMRRFCRPGCFDVAINLFSSFGYLESEQEDRRVLEVFYECLRPGGRLVVEMAHKYWLIRQGRELLWVETPSGFTMERLRFDVFSDRLETERVVVGPRGQVFRRRTSVRQYSLVELAGMAEAVGFELAGAYGSLDGEEPLRLDSRRLVAVFRKP